MFKEKLTPILQNPIQKIEEEGTLLNLFYEASITVTLKPDQKKMQKKKITGQYPLWKQIQNPFLNDIK